MKKYVRIEIETASAEESEILIAELSEIDFYSFEEKENTLIAYIEETDYDEDGLKEILAGKRKFAKAIIEEENWNRQWESGIQPVIVNQFAAVRPSFHPPVVGVKHDLIITPKMSFGTGHHATTFLMIELMETINFQNKTVLDFGTGTGVLAILAEKCGASKITAMDCDEWSIRNTLENVEANHCKNILVEKKSDPSGIEPVDVILANINLNVLVNAASVITSLLKPGSLFLTSGFLDRNENEMQNIFGEKDVVKKQIRQSGEWMAILFQKSQGRIL
ncbi:MAG: 50S ribosomal protein L11 methyltransferase [Ginsengibacter sp.]